VLILDGEPRDGGAIAEAVQAVAGDAARLTVLLVAPRVADWAHWELGDDPRSLRREIELEQHRSVSRMLGMAGLEGGYATGSISSSWRESALPGSVRDYGVVIVSTRRRFVRWRASRAARREGLSLRRVPDVAGADRRGDP
jgi:hypothetical protein